MFSKIHDKYDDDKDDVIPVIDTKHDKDASNKLTPTVQKSKLNIPRPTMLIIIGVVVVAVIALVIFLVIRNSRNEVNNVKKDLEAAHEAEELLKSKIENYNTQVKNMETVIKQQQLQMNSYKADLSEYENKFTNFDNQTNNKINVPRYEMDTQYDEKNPGAHIRKEDPRLQEREQVKNLVNQRRETVEEQQNATKNKIEVLNSQNDKKVQQELKSLNNSQQYISDESEYDDNDKIFNALDNGNLIQ